MSDATRNSAPAFTELEEEFFRAGEALEQLGSRADLDDGYEPPSLWRRLLGRPTADRRG